MSDMEICVAREGKEDYETYATLAEGIAAARKGGHLLCVLEDDYTLTRYWHYERAAKALAHWHTEKGTDGLTTAERVKGKAGWHVEFDYVQRVETAMDKQVAGLVLERLNASEGVEETAQAWSDAKKRWQKEDCARALAIALHGILDKALGDAAEAAECMQDVCNAWNALEEGERNG